MNSDAPVQAGPPRALPARAPGRGADAGRRHPFTRPAEGEGEALFELYRAAGYLSPSGRAEQDFAELRADFLEASARLSAAPSLGCQVVWPSDRGHEAAISVLKLYQRAWFGFQMAKRPGRVIGEVPGRRILREIHLHAYGHVAIDPGARWLIGYVQHGTRFSHLVHHEFPARHLCSGRAAVVPFRGVQGRTDGSFGALPEGVEISFASGEEVRLLLATLPSLRGAAYLEAHDLVPSRFDLLGLRAAWSAAGLARTRRVLVCRRAGRATAAAVVETAQAGLHLYGLFDVARLFPLSPGGEADFAHLLEGARAFYREAGKRTFFYFCEQDAQRVLRPGLEDLGGADMTIFSASLMPRFLEHVERVTEPRRREERGA